MRHLLRILLVGATVACGGALLSAQLASTTYSGTIARPRSRMA